MAARKKKFTQRATIILTDNSNGNFDLDCVFEPSIKGRVEEAMRRSPAARAARDANLFIISRYGKPEIIITDQ